MECGANLVYVRIVHALPMSCDMLVSYMPHHNEVFEEDRLRPLFVRIRQSRNPKSQTTVGDHCQAQQCN
jgi:hypothetical protein